MYKITTNAKTYAEDVKIFLDKTFIMRCITKN